MDIAAEIKHHLEQVNELYRLRDEVKRANAQVDRLLEVVKERESTIEFLQALQEEGKDHGKRIASL